MNFVPLNDYVLIEPSSVADKTPGGIVLPEKAKEKPTRGKVLAVGSGQLLFSGERAKMSVAIGDTVVYTKFGTVEIDDPKDSKRKLVLIRENDILGIER